MRIRTSIPGLCLILLLLMIIGCHKQQEAVSAEIGASSSGSLYIAPRKGIPMTIFLDMKDSTVSTAPFTADVRKAITGERYKIVDSPASAGYILHINIVRHGPLDPAVMTSVINAGYGAEAEFSGQGGTGLVADVLLVQRSVPQESRPSQTRLKNISNRNAKNHAQIRFGLLVEGENAGMVDSVFSKALAKEVKAALLAQNPETNQE